MQVARVVDGAAGGLDLDRDRAVVDVELCHLQPLDHGAQGGGDGVYGHIKVSRLAPVDPHGQLRLGLLVFDLGIVELRRALVDRRQEIIGRGGDIGVVRPGQGEFQLAAGAPQIEAVRRADAGRRARDRLQRPAQTLGDVELVAPRPPFGQRGDDVVPVEVPAPHDREDVFDLAPFAQRFEQGLRLDRLPVHVVETDAVGPLHHDDDVAAVLLRQQFLVDGAVDVHRGQRHQRHAAQDQQPGLQGEFEDAAVGVAQNSTDPGERRGQFRFAFRQARGEHRA